MNGKEIKIETDTIIKKLDNKIDEILRENNRKIDESEKEAIKNFENTISNVYVGNILFFENHINKIQDIFLNIKQILNKIQIIIIIITILLLIIIFLFERNFNIIGISLLASGMFCIIVNRVTVDKFQNLLILSPAFSDMLMLLMNLIIRELFIIGLVLIIIGIISIILENIRKENGKK